jgi:hypothetical protein
LKADVNSNAIIDNGSRNGSANDSSARNALSVIGDMYSATLPGAIGCGGQAYSNLTSMSLPAGKYIFCASANTPTTSNIVVLSISLNSGAGDDRFKQSIYGHVGYDANAGSVTAILEVAQNQTVYFTCWCENYTTMTPTNFSAIRIK